MLQGGSMTIADIYRAMSEDIRGRAQKITIQEVRRAHLALADLWSSRAASMDGEDLVARQDLRAGSQAAPKAAPSERLNRLRSQFGASYPK